MPTNLPKKLALLCLALAISQLPALSQTDISLPNFSFNDGLNNWRTRTGNPVLYKAIPATADDPAAAQLTVTRADSAMEREAIYFSRADLPVREGYYRLEYETSTKLKSGNSVVTIGAFAEKEKLLASYNSAAEGAPAGMGESGWTKTGFVYYIPAGAVLAVVQLELKYGDGSSLFRNLRLTHLDAAMGKKQFDSQKTRLTFPPFKQMPERTPRYPLKTQRLIFTNEDVARARANIAKYPAARKLQETFIKAADVWLEYSDEDLRGLMPDGRVPRGFDLCPKGCPVHGIDVFKYGTYPWLLDPRHPLQVKCPIGGELYPSNDYETYYKSGFKDKENWDGPHTDDGWGWVAPDGERYWFVAYANHWMWNKYVIPGLSNLSRAYLLTGDKRYAHKAAVMLYRLAEIYPSMDHVNQSRYGALMRSQGKDYPGKILNHIAETFLTKQYAEAYDNVWDSIDADSELQKTTGKTGEQLRSFIEANLLEDAIDAYMINKIEGNYGMHQNALLQTLLARQSSDNSKYFDMLVNAPGADAVHAGLRYAIFNSVYRDGLAIESPAYSAMWIENYAALGDLLRKGGYDLFAEPRLKMLFDGPLKSVVIGKFTPDWGDSGDSMGAILGNDADTYRIGYRAYKDAAYLPWLANAKQTGPNGFTTFASLFQPVLPETPALPGGRVLAPQPSRLLAGFGLGLLNNPADTTALALTYGYHGSHFHWDFLNFELFANGQKMMPDLGYPDAMNEYVQEIFTWSTNTVAHNTVVVDAQRQELNLPGTLHSFADGAFARSVDASTKSYSQTSEYRRNLIMVDADKTHSYTVDFFRVTGGKQHDYSLHGPPGETTIVDGKYSEVKPGTLAGPDVKLGQIYDDQKLGAEGYNGSYSDYRGSGFQYLYNVQQLESGNGTLQCQHLKDKKAQLRIHLLPVEQQDVYIADAYDKPRARTYTLKFLIARRKAAGTKPLKSTFVSVLETYGDKPYVQATKLLKLSAGTGNAVEVQRQGATDIVISDNANSQKILAAYDIKTDANSAVITLGAGGEVQRVFISDGKFLSYGKRVFKAPPIEGIVTGVDAQHQKLIVQLDSTSSVTGKQVTGKVAHFTNALRTTAHPVAASSVEGGQLQLTTADAVLVGCVNVKGSNGDSISTDTSLPFASLYHGATVLTADMKPAGLIKEANTSEVVLTSVPKVKLAAGKDVWLSDIGIGDRMTIKSTYSWAAPLAKPKIK